MSQCNATPFMRPDHKSKKHGRPKPAKFGRRTERRQSELAIGQMMGVE